AVTEFDRVAVGIGDAAIVADRIRLFARRPEKPVLAARPLGHVIHRRAAFEREAEMAEVALGTAAFGPARDEDEDELLLAARFGKPRDRGAGNRVASLVHLHEATEFAVERDALREIAAMQRHMRQHRPRHGRHSPATATRAAAAPRRKSSPLSAASADSPL